METFVTVIHYIVSLFLIVVILLQAGKGADIGAVFGGGGSQTVFGSRGPATILNKITIVMAIMFLVTSISLAHFTKIQGTKSVIQTEDMTSPIETTQPLDKNTTTNEVPEGSK